MTKKKTIAKLGSFKLSSIKPFTWRRKHVRCKKTVFNFVAVYNDFEAEFAQFLDDSTDIERFAALANQFHIDYLSSRGAIRFYYPDFVAVQNHEGNLIYWIIETKGREFEDTDKKDAAMDKWCKDVSEQSNQTWHYVKVLQKDFDKIKNHYRTFKDLRKNLT